MITTVVFDVGNTLMRFPWGDHTAKLFDPETAEIINDAAWGHDLWKELDRNAWPVEKVVAEFKKFAPGHEEDFQTAFDRVGECLVRCDYAIPWLKELREKGYRVLYLSNYHEHLMRANPSVLDFVLWMDGGIFSCFYQQIKPDRDIYETLFREYHLRPEECLFVDDAPENIRTASELGMHVELFRGYETSYPAVMKLLEEKGAPERKKS